ncbi:dihydrofolate reductase [bacterium]|nr:dihydrofolate reductase [bacterium]
MISLIAAVGKNNELGKDNDLLWHIKDDLENFKNLTMGKYIVMGANTYYSLPKKLKGRKYIVLSKKIKVIEQGMVFSSFDDLLNFIKLQKEEVMIIGGASIYSLFMPFCDKIYLTEIEDSKEADVYFPKFDKRKFQRKVLEEKECGDLKYKFVVYER